MRRGSGAEIVFDKDVFIGVNLGSDACTEHEIGIKELRNYFGMDSNKNGIEKRKITKIPVPFSEYSRELRFLSFYWLNPMEQKIHNYGWFTVEDLLLWAENKGPIPKTSV